VTPPQLTSDQAAALNAAGAAYNVDPRLIEAVWGKEYSFAQAPSGWFDSFGLIAGPGEYNGTGYKAAQNTFSDAVNTVAAYIASTRADYSASGKTEPFLQYFDNIYSPPASNPNSYPNLLKIYAGLGGDVSGEAYKTDPASGTGGGFGNDATGQKILDNAPAASNSAGGPFGGVTDAINNFTKTAQDLALNAGMLALALALIAGAFAIWAAGDPTVRSAVETAGKAAAL
jgi:hypothetical protein